VRDYREWKNPFVCAFHAVYKINDYPGSVRDENQKSLRFKNP
jgi:hypothetical protein